MLTVQNYQELQSDIQKYSDGITLAIRNNRLDLAAACLKKILSIGQVLNAEQQKLSQMTIKLASSTPARKAQLGPVLENLKSWHKETKRLQSEIFTQKIQDIKIAREVREFELLEISTESTPQVAVNTGYFCRFMQWLRPSSGSATDADVKTEHAASLRP